MDEKKADINIETSSSIKWNILSGLGNHFGNYSYKINQKFISNEMGYFG